MKKHWAGLLSITDAAWRQAKKDLKAQGIKVKVNYPKVYFRSAEDKTLALLCLPEIWHKDTV